MESLNELADKGGTEELLEILECLEGNVYVIQTIPPNAKLATGIVLSQAQGMHLKPIDTLRARVCDHVKEEERDAIATAWNSLESKVHRSTIQTACLYLAQAQQNEITQPFREFKMMETYVEDYFSKNTSMDGRHLFENEVEPACSILDQFRKSDLQIAPPNDEVNASLEFLRVASKRVEIGGDIEMVVMKFLMWHEETTGSPHEQKIVQGWLKKLESVALWILVAKPKCKVRRAFCLKILKRATSVFNDQKRAKHFEFLSTKQKIDLGKKLDEISFDGSNFRDKTLVKSILERLERHDRIERLEKHGLIEAVPINSCRNTVERIWNGDDMDDDWSGALGNYALVVSGKAGKPTDRLDHRFGSSVFSLTKSVCEIAAARDDPSALASRHDELLGLAARVWDFDLA
jgi:hypothetical protein